MLDDEQRIVSNGLKDLYEGCSEYYEKVKSDLLYESGSADSTESNESGQDVDRLMYLRKSINRVVNPVILNPYSVMANAKDPDKEWLDEALNDAIDEVVDSDNARDAYSVGFRTCCISGIGYISIETDFLDDESLAQTIEIKREPNPVQILGDKASCNPDGSDSNKMAKIGWIDEKFAVRTHGKEVKVDNWHDSMFSCIDSKPEGMIPEVMYLYKQKASKSRYFDDQGAHYDEMPEDKNIIQTRQVSKTVIRIIKYIGNKKVFDDTIPMEYIPIVPIKGDLTYCDSGLKEEYRGMVYLGKPSNETANYYYSKEKLLADSAPTPQFLVDLESMPTGNAAKPWSDFNKTPRNFLGYMSNTGGANAKPLNPPMRLDNTPQFIPYIEAREKAQNDIRETLGLPDPTNAEDANTASGRSVFLRQKQAEMATIHYQKNLERSIKQVTRIVIDLIGLVDTKPRVITVEDPDTGENVEKKIVLAELGINNRMFDIELVNGSLHESKKQESLNMLFEAAVNPQLAPVLDLLVKGSGVQNESEIVERFEKMLPPELRDETNVPDEAKQIMDQQSATIDQFKGALDDANDAIRLLQNALQEKDKEIQSKVVIEEMKIQGKLADTRLKIQGELAKEEGKQTGETLRNLQNIEADLESDLLKLKGELMKTDIPNQVDENYEYSTAPRTTSVVKGSMKKIRP